MIGAIVLRAQETDFGFWDVIAVYQKFHFCAIFAKKNPADDAESNDGGGAVDSLDGTRVIGDMVGDEIFSVWCDR